MEKIIKKLEKRQRITEKLKDEIYKLQQKINEIKGIKTINYLVEFVKEDEEDTRNDIYFGIIKGNFGLYNSFDVNEEIKENCKDIDDYINDIGIKNTLKGLKTILKKIENVKDFSEYDKSLKDLLF